MSQKTKQHLSSFYSKSHSPLQMDIHQSLLVLSGSERAIGQLFVSVRSISILT